MNRDEFEIVIGSCGDRLDLDGDVEALIIHHLENNQGRFVARIFSVKKKWYCQLVDAESGKDGHLLEFDLFIQLLEMAKNSL